MTVLKVLRTIFAVIELLYLIPTNLVKIKIVVYDLIDILISLIKIIIEMSLTNYNDIMTDTVLNNAGSP